MFIKFSKNKTQYEKGQIFPFLLALLVVVVILIMITVNLGQIGILRTDTSNSADAGALAGASTLSGTLLSLGIQSDGMLGYTLTIAGGMLYMLGAFIFPIGLVKAISLWFMALMKSISSYPIALGTSTMGWTSAKKTAIQYAFNNLGVDEPRPTYEQFIAAVNADSSRTYNSTDLSYENYLRGVGWAVKDHARSGFSQFMEDDARGWWNNREFGEIKPFVIGTPGPSGYGWQQEEDKTFSNSYGENRDYTEYENWVEVRVDGASMYEIEPFNLQDGKVINLVYAAAAATAPLMYFQAPPVGWAGEACACPPPATPGCMAICILIKLLIAVAELEIYNEMVKILPAGIKFSGGADSQTKNNPITVTVARRKGGDQNLGVWNFRYGDLRDTAFAHVFPENSATTIEPALGDINLLDFVAPMVNTGLGAFGALAVENFKVSNHLFETELYDGK